MDREQLIKQIEEEQNAKFREVQKVKDKIVLAIKDTVDMMNEDIFTCFDIDGELRKAATEKKDGISIMLDELGDIMSIFREQCFKTKLLFKVVQVKYLETPELYDFCMSFFNNELLYWESPYEFYGEIFKASNTYKEILQKYKTFYPTLFYHDWVSDLQEVRGDLDIGLISPDEFESKREKHKLNMNYFSAECL